MFLLVRFKEKSDLDEVAAALEELPFVRLSGDWHEARKEKMSTAIAESGGGFGRFPLESLERDRLQGGPSVAIEISLDDVISLSGQLRSSGLLVSRKSLPASNDCYYSNLQELKRVFQQRDWIVSWELS